MRHRSIQGDFITYTAQEARYATTEYRRCGDSGLRLPPVSLGLWHNFGDNADYSTMCKMCFTAFDNGITHFDPANNYGPEAGSAERNFGKIKKYLVASPDASLKRLGLDYVC